jgi:GTPase Era involved in 16S rRNA processing
MTETRNILIIGRTGNGKSALTNVITGTNNFKESDYGVSETKKMQSEEFATENGINYRIIDTVGFDDTNLLPKEVMNRIATTICSVKDGLNQILFVTNRRFTEEEIKVYDLLQGFDEEIVKYTTIVRTNFPKFGSKEKCEEDLQRMIEENEKLVEIIEKCGGFIHVDNPSVNDEEEIIRSSHKKTREKSKEIVLNRLRTCKETYKPKNPDKANEKIN